MEDDLPDKKSSSTAAVLDIDTVYVVVTQRHLIGLLLLQSTKLIMQTMRYILIFWGLTDMTSKLHHIIRNTLYIFNLHYPATCISCPHLYRLWIQQREYESTKRPINLL